MSTNEHGIWFKRPTVVELNEIGHGNLIGHLGIVFNEVGDDYLIASMPVHEITHQPFGILHGGATVALAETVASAAAQSCVDTAKTLPVGLEINANHIRSVQSGLVFARAEQAHGGSSTQVWSIRVTDDEDRLVAISRLTIALIEAR